MIEKNFYIDQLFEVMDLKIFSGTFDEEEMSEIKKIFFFVI